MMLLGHIQKGDSTATIIKIALGTAQQQLGIAMPLLESNFSKYGFLLEPCWFKTVWFFLFQIGGSITIPELWKHESPFENNICLMDKVLEINVPSSTISQFNLCRLFKEIHFVTDILDSQQRKLHPEIFRPAKRPFKHMKWSVIQVPNNFWRTWEAIIKTIHMSMKVSGFYPGKSIRKELFRFLQSTDRKHLLHKIGDKSYHVYTLQEFGRNKYIYSRENIYLTVRYSLVGFRGVPVQVFHDIIVMDGFSNDSRLRPLLAPSSKKGLFYNIPSIVHHIISDRRRNYMKSPHHSILPLPPHMCNTQICALAKYLA